MRTTLAFLVCITLAHAGTGIAQDADDGSNPRTKTESPVQPGPSAPLPPDLLDLARKAAALADAGGDELPEARRLMGNLRADARFEALPQDFRYRVLGVAGFVEMADGQAEAARTLFRQALELQDTNPDLWYWLSGVESGLDLHDDAARSLARLFKGWPEVIDNIDDYHIYSVANETSTSGTARTELLQAIFDSGWQREALGGPSHYHYELALIRARQGDIDALRRIVPSVDGPSDIVRMRIDKRFDAVVDRDDPAFDPRAAAERRVKTLQAQVRRAPDRLDIVSALQTALLVVGRFQDVITLAEDVQAAIAVAPADKPAYTDLDHLPWVQNQHANALDALGRFDDSTRRLEAASRLDEAGMANVSQALNLAQLYANLDRPDEALAAVARAGSNMSDFGRMAKAAIEHSAHLLKGETGLAAGALAYLRQNRDKAEEIHLAALVEAGDIDTAATLVVAQLASDEDRADALFEFQDFNDLPRTPGAKRYLANWEKLEDHPGVKAALEKVGRKTQVDLYWSE